MLIESQSSPGCFYLFVPENEGGPIVTGPAAGDAWRHFLSGRYNPDDPGMWKAPGCVCEHTGKDREYHYFDTLDEMKKYFFKRLEELKQGNLLGSARLSEFGKVTYRWDFDTTEPVQEKWELHLSGNEQEAVSDFVSRHRMCGWYYPHPNDDGLFSYEVIPSSASPEFRKIRVTCRFCGAYVESDSGEISYGKPCKKMRPESERYYTVPIEKFRGDMNG